MNVYLVACGAPPAARLAEFIDLLHATRPAWQVYIIATPQAMQFINRPQLERLSGAPIRSEYKAPGTPDPFPKPDRIVVAPLTFTTLNKWALGIGDTLAASILCEALGAGTPTVAAPCFKWALYQHPAVPGHLRTLIEAGVRVLHEPDRYPSPAIVPWAAIVEALGPGVIDVVNVGA
jgi:phosphopantothenoylcysteine decarboxylase